jgi:hypothetical protein
MASRKIDEAKYGPGWGEIIFGAALSLALGAALALGYLVIKPVKVVGELPKDRPAGAVYYIEGGSSADRGKQWMRKKALLVQGSSVTLNEDELNAWIDAETGPAASPAPAAGPKAATAGIIELGTPNFRIDNGRLQIGAQGTINLSYWNFKQPIIVQVAGRFVKEDGTFTLEPEEFYIGSCPLHRLPGIGRLVFDHLLARVKVPDDIAAAWKKLAEVTIEDKTLKLTMP